MLRDQALAVSGLLVDQRGGPPVKPYQPINIWEPVAYSDSNTKSYVQDHGDALYRRSLYTFIKRTAPAPAMANFDAPLERVEWVSKLSQGLRKTGSSIAQVFSGTKIDDALYEELETALLMADTGMQATQHLLQDLKRRVKETGTQDPQAVKALLADAIAELLQPLQAPLVIGQHSPTVIMVAAMMPLSTAMERTGAAQLLAEHLVAVVGDTRRASSTSRSKSVASFRSALLK